MASSKKKTKKTTTKTKKTSAKPKKRKATMKTAEEKPLTLEELEEFRQLLWEKRLELVGNVDYMSVEALDGSRQDTSGELSSMPIHMADVGTDNYEQEFTIGLIESERKLLRLIDRALQKIRDGNYGTCEGTGKLIGRARLQAAPEARYCIEFARKLEQGLVSEPDDNGILEGDKK
ncbi:MAG: TraR/DksA C4-type zinc finger protein [Sedimentisphaerales bacterium]|nr:TraR/DksA C4-type zinc finger protein [Sedimentisphaerales bacterium]